MQSSVLTLLTLSCPLTFAQHRDANETAPCCPKSWPTQVTSETGCALRSEQVREGQRWPGRLKPVCAGRPVGLQLTVGHLAGVIG